MSKGPANPERSFGISVGGVLVALALVLLWRRRIGRAELFGAVGAVLLVLGFIRPMCSRGPANIGGDSRAPSATSWPASG